MELQKKKIKTFPLNYQLKTIIKSHNSYVMYTLILKDSRLASASADKSIKIFNINTYEIEINIIEHENYVVHLTQLKDEKLVSSSNDNTIKIFKIYKNYYTIEQTLIGHSNAVKKTIELKNGYLASCSWDKTIKIWNKSNNNLYLLIQELIEKNEIDLISEIKEKEIISFSYDQRSILFYQLENIKFKFVDEIKEINLTGFNSNFCKINEKYFIVGGQRKIYFIDIEKHKINNIYELDNIIKDIDFFHSFYLSKEGILFAGIESSILGFKINNNNIELISFFKNAHEESKDGLKVIQSITEDLNKDIISNSYDGTIKIWIKIKNK